MNRIPAESIRGRSDVLAWFSEHGHDPTTIAARSTDEVIVDVDGNVRCRRYLGTATGAFLDTEPIIVVAKRPFPTEPR